MPKCEVCGEPLEGAEAAFRFHGYSGPCPFADEAAARAAYDDLLATMRSAGAVDVAAQ